MKNFKIQGGYAALVSLLIIGFVVTAIAITVSLLGIGQGQASLALSRGEDTLQFVEGCMEDALLRVSKSASYTGGTITRPEGTCSVTIVSAGNLYTITVTTTATNYKRTIQVVGTRGSNFAITSWKEQ